MHVATIIDLIVDIFITAFRFWVTDICTRKKLGNLLNNFIKVIFSYLHGKNVLEISIYNMYKSMHTYYLLLLGKVLYTIFLVTSSGFNRSGDGALKKSTNMPLRLLCSL